MKKFILIAIAVVILGGVGFQLSRKLGKKEGFVRQGAGAPVAVEAVPVERVTLKDIGEFSGSLLPRSQFVVSPKIGGKLEKLYVDVGDFCKRGQLIAELENEETLQQVEQAKAELDVAKASLQDSQNTLLLMEREYERVKSLQEKQIASVAELDQIEAELNAAEARNRVSLAQIRQKEAALKAAQVRLSYTKIHATWNKGGETRVIGERYVDEGVLLRANDSIVSVLDIETLLAVIKVIERDYPRIRTGQHAVVITNLFPDREFEASVSTVAPILKEAARQAEVSVEVPNSDMLLKPGMFVRVKIEFSRKEDVLSVPLEAIVRRDGEQGVFLVEDDGQRVSFVSVRTGLVYEGRAEVVDPPLDGMVVTLGHHLLEDGSPVMLGGTGEGADTLQIAGPKGDANASGGTPR
jgi:RND family efflux transporter MFP subunit